MRVLVLGAGVIGVTCAWYLRAAGHDVTVIDRQPGPALETSYANAGEISPGYASPWAGPGVPLKALQWIADPHGPLRWYPSADPYQWRWMLQMLRHCTHARYAVNKARMQRLARYSRACFIALRRDTGIAYDDRQLGTLQVFRHERDLAGIEKDVRVLRELGVAHEVLDREGCARVEPGLARVKERIAGGLRLPDDETGDCFLFTQRLESLARERGVAFGYGVRVLRLAVDGARVSGVLVEGGERPGQRVESADAYVVALGSHSPLLTRPAGIDLPVYPVKGYSITVPILDESRAPVSTLMDDAHKVALTRLGGRIRVAGTAEVSGYNDVLRPKRLATLVHVLRELFDGAGDLSRMSSWTGLRPMTPDGPPIVGPTRYGNLHLCTGHGTLGWTMSCGSGRFLADIVSGRAPEVSAEGLGLERYG